MSRTWIRLVACLSMAAFLFANTHAGMASCAHCPDFALPSAACEQDAPHDHHGPAADAQEAADADNHDGDSSCPDCPEEQHCPTCPCPAGCAVCSVAKAPCLNTLIFALTPAQHLVAYLLDHTPSYLAPFHGELTRPPRS